MAHHRTGGMTAIGILNIVFGALGTVAFGLMLLAGGLFAGAGTAAGSAHHAAEAAGMPAVGGGIVMLIGFTGMATSLILLASGIGVLKVAPWGRTLSIGCGVLGIALQGWSMATTPFSIPTLVSLGYCVLLVGLCFTPGWKAAFSAGFDAGQLEDHHGQSRRAA